MIRVWQSYSCNNSSSFRLVARFVDAPAAQATADELRKFFDAHAEEMDVAIAAAEGLPEEPPVAARRLGERYGFTWTDIRAWGDTNQVGDEPSVVAEANVLVAYHPYCSGFGSDVPRYLAARGATSVEPEVFGPPSLTALFISRGDDLAAELDELAELIVERDVGDMLVLPWSGHEVWGTTAMFRDAETAGFVVPAVPHEIAALRHWLADRGIDDPVIRLCEDGDAAAFAAVADARCTACGGPLLYRDPRIHDIEKPQLMCRPCGGFYDVETFVA